MVEQVTNSRIFKDLDWFSKLYFPGLEFFFQIQDPSSSFKDHENPV